MPSYVGVDSVVRVDDRRRFAEMMRGTNAVWLSNEGVRVLPEVGVPPHQGSPFVLVRDGMQPLAFTDPHGTWLQWLG
ncbi:MAG TPA: hypothetical protein VFT62_05600 [Mycobacteriales bacterium]|nr:hypothetical protein [Mycobacteriales bacterium]